MLQNNKWYHSDDIRLSRGVSVEPYPDFTAHLIFHLQGQGGLIHL